MPDLPYSYHIKRYAKNSRISRKLKQSNNRCSKLFKYGKQFRFAPLFNNFLHVSHVASSFSSSEANKPMMTKLPMAVAIQTAIEGIVCTENIVHERKKKKPMYFLNAQY